MNGFFGFNPRAVVVYGSILGASACFGGVAGLGYGFIVVALMAFLI